MIRSWQARELHLHYHGRPGFVCVPEPRLRYTNTNSLAKDTLLIIPGSASNRRSLSSQTNTCARRIQQHTGAAIFALVFRRRVRPLELARLLDLADFVFMVAASTRRILDEEQPRFFVMQVAEKERGEREREHCRNVWAWRDDEDDAIGGAADHMAEEDDGRRYPLRVHHPRLRGEGKKSRSRTATRSSTPRRHCHECWVEKRARYRLSLGCH